MQLWPIYMGVTVLGLAVTAITDRRAFVGLVAVLCGLLAMRAGSSFPPLFALTVWSVAAAICISTRQSLVACGLSIIVALFYLPAVFGWPWYYAARGSDVAGILLLLALIGPSIPICIGSDRRLPGLFNSGPLPSWPRAALQAMARAQKSAPPKSLEWLE